MHLSSLKLTNFKKFKNITIDLEKKIIVLVGPNSVGKTSIIKSILALKQTFSIENESDVFLARGSLVDLGTYGDYIHNHEQENDFSYEGEIAIPSKSFGSLLDAPVDKINFTINYSFDAESDQACLTNILFDIHSAHNKASFNVRGKKTARAGRNSREYTIDVNDLNNISKNSFFIDIFEQSRRKAIGAKKRIYRISDKFNFEAVTDNISDAIYSRFIFTLFDELMKTVKVCIDDNFTYIGPLREKPARYNVRNSQIRYVGASGENTASVLTNLFSHNKEKQKFNQINRDFQELLSKEIIVKRADELTKIRIREADSDREESISDVGFGISQILPILTQANILNSGQRLILEQPELHLHPEIQTKLASILLGSRGLARKYLIETHSEHLIRGLQLAVHRSGKIGAEPTISNKDVDILYINENEIGEAVIKKMRLDDKGDLIDKWPPGFFDQAYKFTMQMLAEK
ncbi:DUF3696 domain-containing protein [Delftia sp. SD018]|uniref:DUF3696 domain-containing protein n=1 Tax=unclassified Delftia TaxID=2613839 RepID=UPI001A9772F5|nr:MULTISPECIES: DUF3696 domain-containing protein [unclassified Delftia]MBO0990642.1 DUF3696 domain-containing protein [Delftia sp. SD083]MBO1037504.1 DUF3696 domain-containing protein [Delftia sp. SD018]